MSNSFRKPVRAGRRAASPSPGLTLLAAACLVGIALVPARAQVQSGPALYKGDSVQSSGVVLSPWGSGAVEEATAPSYSGGTASLKITTQGLYQGAGITLAKPVDLGAYLTVRDAYLQIAVIPPAANPGGPNGGGLPGSFGAPTSAGGLAGVPGSGGPPGSGGYSGGLNSGKRGSVTFLKPRMIENLRVVLITTTNRQIEMLLPLNTSHDEGQWKIVTIPLAAIPGLRPDDAQIKQVRLFADAPGFFRVGKIGVVVDSTPITLLPLEPKVAQGRVQYRYIVGATGGNTPLRISWDWDAADGIQDEAQGRSALHTYRKEGDYTITVTASDYYGLKKPAVGTFKVHVTP